MLLTGCLGCQASSNKWQPRQASSATLIRLRCYGRLLHAMLTASALLNPLLLRRAMFGEGNAAPHEASGAQPQRSAGPAQVVCASPSMAAHWWQRYTAVTHGRSRSGGLTLVTHLPHLIVHAPAVRVVVDLPDGGWVGRPRSRTQHVHALCLRSRCGDGRRSPGCLSPCCIALLCVPHARPTASIRIALVTPGVCMDKTFKVRDRGEGRILQRVNGA